MLKSTLAAVALCAATAFAAPASAMAVDNLVGATQQGPAGATQGQVEQVRLVCGRHRCWQVRPHWRAYRWHHRRHWRWHHRR